MTRISMARMALMTLLVGTASLIGFTGCKDNPSNPGTGNNDLVKPKVGSTYTFATYDTDSTGAKVPGSDSTLVYTVASTTLTLDGKNDCMMLVPSNPNEDTVYVHYESNGDVSQYFGVPDSPLEGKIWITLPFTSKTQISSTLMDTSYVDSSGLTTQVKLQSSQVGSGSENVTVGAGTFSAQKVKWTLASTLTIGPFPVSLTAQSDMWFAPKIGFIVKLEGKTTGGFAGFGGNGGNVQTLTSYSLK